MAGVIEISKYAHSPIHKAVITKDYEALTKVLTSLPRLADPSDITTEAASIDEEVKADKISSTIDRRDVPNRETPLHISVKLADAVSAEMLMVAGADWSLQNEQGWSPLQEAICNREEHIAKIIVQHYQPLAWAKWCRRLPRVVETMRRIKDFYMEITFHFESSVIPFISRIAPSDTYKIWKRGSNLRADMTLAGFDGFRIQRSDQSVLFLGDGSEDGRILPGSLCMISHKDKEIMNALDGAGAPATEAEIELEVSSMLKTNIFRPGLDVTQAILLPQMTWRRQEKTEMVGSWKAKVYDMHHVVVSVKSRRVPGAMTDDEFFSSCNNENDTESENYDDILTEDEKKQLELALNMDSDKPDKTAAVATPTTTTASTTSNGFCSNTDGEEEDGEEEELNINGAKQDKKGWFGNWRGSKKSKMPDDMKKVAAPRKSLHVDSKVGNLLDASSSSSNSQTKAGRHSVDGSFRVVEGEEEYKKGKSINKDGSNSMKKKANSSGGGGNRESEYKKGLRPVLWLSPNFPLRTEELLPLLDIIANKVKAIRRLRELLTTKLPAGTFPVKVCKVAAIMLFRRSPTWIT